MFDGDLSAWWQCLQETRQYWRQNGTLMVQQQSATWAMRKAVLNQQSDCMSNG
jgi:hypothetical protein